MIISPSEALKNGWITWPEWMAPLRAEKSIQPNAIDFTLDKLFSVDATSVVTITESTRTFRNNVEIKPNAKNEWELLPGQLYDGMSDFYVSVPQDVACILIIRSSFNRNGISLTSGLYDSGFKGNIGFTLHNRSGKLITAPNTRVGQIMFVSAKSVGQYQGIYNADNGTHWASHVSKNNK